MIDLIDILNNIIKEGKMVGVLYHLMGYSELLFNLTNDKIGGKDYHKLSFTRNKNFNEIPKQLPKNKVLSKFVLDGNKLSNNYKIKPIQDPSSPDEFEETIKGIIKNLGKYIIEIQIFNNVLFSLEFQKQQNVKKIIEEYLSKYSNIQIKYIK